MTCDRMGGIRTYFEGEGDIDPRLAGDAVNPPGQVAVRMVGGVVDRDFQSAIDGVAQRPVVVGGMTVEIYLRSRCNSRLPVIGETFRRDRCAEGNARPFTPKLLENVRQRVDGSTFIVGPRRHGRRLHLPAIVQAKPDRAKHPGERLNFCFAAVPFAGENRHRLRFRSGRSWGPLRRRPSPAGQPRGACWLRWRY